MEDQTKPDTSRKRTERGPERDRLWQKMDIFQSVAQNESNKDKREHDAVVYTKHQKFIQPETYPEPREAAFPSRSH